MQCMQHPKTVHSKRSSKSGIFRESMRVNLMRILLYKKLIFDFSLFKLREHGFQSISRLRRSTKKPICNSNVNRFESVRIVDCFAVIVMIFYGISAALILLCVELILNKWHSFATNSHWAEKLSRKN